MTMKKYIKPNRMFQSRCGLSTGAYPGIRHGGGCCEGLGAELPALGNIFRHIYA